LGIQNGIGTRLCQRKAENGQEKGLANVCRRVKVKKKVHAGRGPEAEWEIPFYLVQSIIAEQLSRKLLVDARNESNHR
jgi:hypothetical protein